LSAYAEALRTAMGILAADERTLFLGQAVKYPGQAAFKTFDLVPTERRIELPVAEDFQMGLCAGLALEGFIPVSFYCRWDFLLLAANQLVNHLDKMWLMGWRPKVIIRVAVGRTKPMDPGLQHLGDYTEAFRLMLKTIVSCELLNAEDIVPAYQRALDRDLSTILVERMDLYE
jgi:pyruvate/2-oxoglutarate/acetoin dehydrogenase E1 component